MGQSIGCIVQKYGPKIATILSLQKVQEVLQQKVSQMNDAMTQAERKATMSFNITLEQQKARIDKVVTKTKEDIGDKKLQKFAKAQNKTIDQIFSTEEFDQKFEDVSKQFKQRIKEQLSQVNQQIDQSQKRVKKQIKEEKPSVPLFSTLTDSKKEQVINAVTDKFVVQMKETQEKYIDTFTKLFNPIPIRHMFDNDDSGQNLVSIADSAEGSFKGIRMASRGGLSCFKK